MVEHIRESAHGGVQESVQGPDAFFLLAQIDRLVNSADHVGRSQRRSFGLWGFELAVPRAT